jgi:hypothetical protein
VPLLLVKKVPVGAIIDRPWILPKQNPSPQGENKVISLRKIRKTAFFGGRSVIAPTFSWESTFFDCLKQHPMSAASLRFSEFLPASLAFSPFSAILDLSNFRGDPYA